MASEKRDLRHVTYAKAGIVPQEFYAGKFAGGQSGPLNLLSDPISHLDIELDRAKFLAEHVIGPEILDIGCGSAPYAGTLRAKYPAAHFVGIDLDPECVQRSRAHYDEAFCFELGTRLPFDDGRFSTVFSCDVFGHIEFRDKDRVISEIGRITARNGRSVHIIESGFLDYDAVNYDNDQDPHLRYIRMEGHIGVETAQDLRERWLRFFRDVHIENAFIHPLATVDTVIADEGAPAELRDLLRSATAQERKTIHALLGYLNKKLKREASLSDADCLFPDHTSNNPLKRPCGLVYLIAKNPYH
jgi:SAM-dependent methyltransferase